MIKEGAKICILFYHFPKIRKSIILKKQEYFSKRFNCHFQDFTLLFFSQHKIVNKNLPPVCKF
jgi:hypothetical protein